MITYPSISREVSYGRDWLVYDKLDGQNIRAEWFKKRGFWKFGSRKVLAVLPRDCFDLINEQEAAIAAVFKKFRVQKAVCFFEYYGDNSFAGMHQQGDQMKVALLDIYLIDRKQWLDPRELEKAFRGKVPMPELLFRGNFNKADEAAVRAGCFRGVTFEGVVCKAPPASKGHGAIPSMFKVKSQAWVDRVRAWYGDKAEELI